MTDDVTGRSAAGGREGSAPHRRRGPLVTAAVVALLVGSLTACGSSTGASDTLPTSMDALVQQAKSEGEVAWSAPKPQDQMQPAIDLFEQKYPGITVTYTNTKAPDQVSQLKVEQAARKVSVDVANAGGLTVVPSLNLADDIDWATYGIPADDIFEGKLVYIWAAPKVWAYNTTKVAAGDVPTTWDDLLEPQWSGGQVSAEGRASFMTVWELNPSMGGEDKALAWAQQFSTQDPHFTSNTTEAEAPIESGQVALGTSLINLVLDAKAKGAPVEVAPLSPTNANESYLYVPNGAPHPAAAVLLTSFLSSDEAQQALSTTYNSRIPVNTDCSNPGENAVLQAICAAHLQWHATATLEDYNNLSDFFPKAEKALGTSAGG